MYNEEQLRHYADLGLSVAETALVFEADRSSISRYAKKFGVVFVKKYRKTNEEKRNKIIQMIGYGKTNREIVEMLNLSTATVSKLRREMNGQVSRPRKKKQVTSEENKTSTKVRIFDLKPGDPFEVTRNFNKKKQTETFTAEQVYNDLFLGINRKGIKETFQKKEYEYGLI